MVRFFVTLLITSVVGSFLAILAVRQQAGAALGGSEAGVGPGPFISTEAILAYIFIIPILVWLQGMWAYYWPRWWLRHDGTETGPFSVYHLGRMLRTNQIGRQDEICKRWSSVWTPFTILVRPAPRIAVGLIGAVVGLGAGGGVGYFLFGQVGTSGVQGAWIKPEWVFEKPRIDEPLWVDFARAGAPVASKTEIPGVKQAGQFLQEADRIGQEKVAAVYRAVDYIRLSAIVGAVGLALLFAVSERESYRLVRGTRTEQPSASGTAVAPQTGSVVKPRLTCPRCHKPLSVDGSHAGRKVKCRGCGVVLRVPQGIACSVETLYFRAARSMTLWVSTRR